jgi:TonB family protein
MQPSASESFSKTLQNPTVLAMLGSAGVHVILVIISALKPAEGQPQRFQIVNLPPKASTNKTVPTPGSGSNLPVPNRLPPVNLGNVPELGALPDFSAFRPPSQSFFTGSNSGFGVPPIDPNQLRIRNPPQRSFPNSPRPKSTSPAEPNGVTSLQPPNTAQLPNVIASGNSPSTLSDPNNRQFSGTNSKLSSLSAEPFSARNTLNELYGQQPSQSSSTPTTSTALPNSPGSDNTDSDSTETKFLDSRKNLTRWLTAQSLLNVHQMSAQKGPQLTATYPIESCASQQNGTAVIAAVYGPDGSVSSQSGAVQILESAPNQAMNQSAIAAVSAYRPEPKKVPQAFTFTVDIPYSSAVCASAQPKSAPKSSPSASPSVVSPSVSPKPSATPSKLPQSSSPKPKPSAAQSSAPSPSTLESTPTPSTSPQPPAPSPSVMPPESPSASPSSSAPPTTLETAPSPSTPNLESLPSPSISVPESTPAPAPESTPKP